MNPYLYVFSLLSFFAVLSTVKMSHNYKLIIYIYLVVVLILFSGLRQLGVGNDDEAYVNMFLSIPDISHWLSGDYIYSLRETQMEVGYLAISSTVRFFTNDYVFLFLVIASISIGISCYNYYRYSPYIFLTLVLFFVHTYLYRDMNQIRAACAAAIGLYLINQIYLKQIKKGVLTILVCGLFHTAALALIIPFSLSFLKVTRKKLILIFSISFVFGAIGISSFLLNILPGGNYITSKLISYSSVDKYVESVSLFDLSNIKNIILFFLFIFYWNKIESKVKYFKIMMVFYTVGVSWRILFSDFGIIAGRVSTFFSIVEVILIPCLLLAFKNKIIPIIVIILYAFITLYLNLYVKDGRFPYYLSVGVF